MRIDPPISSETGAAGDEITGVVEHDVKSKGQVVVRATDKLHGRLLRFEQFLVPQARWLVAIRFDSIERDGVVQPVTFKAVDDGLKKGAACAIQRPADADAGAGARRECAASGGVRSVCVL